MEFFLSIDRNLCQSQARKKKISSSVTVMLSYTNIYKIHYYFYEQVEVSPCPHEHKLQETR